MDVSKYKEENELKPASWQIMGIDWNGQNTVQVSNNLFTYYVKSQVQ